MSKKKKHGSDETDSVDDIPPELLHDPDDPNSPPLPFEAEREASVSSSGRRFDNPDRAEDEARELDTKRTEEKKAEQFIQSDHREHLPPAKLVTCKVCGNPAPLKRECVSDGFVNLPPDDPRTNNEALANTDAVPQEPRGESKDGDPDAARKEARAEAASDASLT